MIGRKKVEIDALGSHLANMEMGWNIDTDYYDVYNHSLYLKKYSDYSGYVSVLNHEIISTTEVYQLQ